jgi:hypothetical protein
MRKVARHGRLIYYHPRSLCGLSTAERTGSPVLHTLWSYVPEAVLGRFIGNEVQIIHKIGLELKV